MLGIISANGAGKTTFCQVLSGILKPDCGHVWVDGRVTALLTFGTGLNLELTRRDNVFLNGMMLGIPKRRLSAVCERGLDAADLNSAAVTQQVSETKDVEEDNAKTENRVENKGSRFGIDIEDTEDIALTGDGTRPTSEPRSSQPRPFGCPARNYAGRLFKASSRIVVAWAIGETTHARHTGLFINHRQLIPALPTLCLLLLAGSCGRSAQGSQDTQVAGISTSLVYQAEFAPGDIDLWHVSPRSAEVDVTTSPNGDPVLQVRPVELPDGSLYIFRRLSAHAEPPLELEIAFRVNGWKQINYVVAGWWDEEDHFWYERINHVKQDAWQTTRVRSGSLLFKITNGWRDPSPHAAHLIRLVVCGTPGPDAVLEVRDVRLTTNDASTNEPLLRIDDQLVLLNDLQIWWPHFAGRPRDAAFQRLHQLLERNPSALQLSRAETLRRRGQYWLIDTGAPITVPPDWDGRDPPSPEPSHRFRWHALEPVSYLVEAYRQTEDPVYVAMARDHAGRWLDAHFQTAVTDPMYVWYDMGTALRVLQFLALWDLGTEQRFDALFMLRLLDAIHAHGELLASPGFVARNQPIEYHNHAVFQAAALMAIGAVIPEYAEAHTWRELGARRCLDQFRHLVTDEGVLVENSLGYHMALMHIAGVLAEFMAAHSIEGADELAQIRHRMRQFDNAIRYPDGVLPAHGDTWYSPDRHQVQRNADSADGDRLASAFFPSSGYAALRSGTATGDIASLRQLNFFCPSLSVTHKHSDHLSITLWAADRRWLIDPGFYGYGLDNPHQEYCHHPRAHNCLVLDDSTYDPAPGTAAITAWGTDGNIAFVQGRHSAYPDATVERTVLYRADQDAFFIEDVVHTSRSRPLCVKQWFHAAPDLVLEPLEGNAIRLAAEGAPLELLVIPLVPDDAEMMLYKGQMEPFVAGWHYTGYKQASPSPSWCFRQEVGATATTFLTALVFVNSTDELPLNVLRDKLRGIWEDSKSLIQDMPRSPAAAGEARRLLTDFSPE